MDEMAKKEFTVNGFLFGSKDDVELAKTELVTVKYIEKKIENRNIDEVLSVYQGALERKLFRTPIGYAYLHELRKRILLGGVPKESLQPIPIYQVYNNRLLEEEPHRREITVPKRKKKDGLKLSNRILIIVNIVLICLLIALFVISINGSSPTILNYRNVIQNEYSKWEQELKERESKVREKERIFNIEKTVDKKENVTE